jgi:hypothetical protein
LIFLFVRFTINQELLIVLLSPGSRDISAHQEILNPLSRISSKPVDSACAEKWWVLKFASELHFCNPVPTSENGKR